MGRPQDNILVDAVGFDRSVIENREITVRIASNTSTALGGIWVSHEILATERPLPTYAASIRPAASIAGGLLSGESMTASDYHFMESREIEFAQETSELSIRFMIENAVDISMDGFPDHPRMGSWLRNMTASVCASRIAQ